MSLRGLYRCYMQWRDKPIATVTDVIVAWRDTHAWSTDDAVLYTLCTPSEELSLPGDDNPATPATDSRSWAMYSLSTLGIVADHCLLGWTPEPPWLCWIMSLWTLHSMSTLLGWPQNPTDRSVTNVTVHSSWDAEFSTIHQALTTAGLWQLLSLCYTLVNTMRSTLSLSLCLSFDRVYIGIHPSLECSCKHLNWLHTPEASPAYSGCFYVWRNTNYCVQPYTVTSDPQSMYMYP